MSKKIITLVAVAVLILIANTQANAGFIENGTRFDSRTEMPGFESCINGESSDAWYHQIEENNGHWHKAQSYGSYYLEIEQGFMNKNILPIGSEIKITRWNDEGRFSIRAEFEMIFTDLLHADYLNTPSGGRNWNTPDINYGTSISLGHKNIYNDKGSYQTTDIVGGFHYYFQDSILEDATDSVNDLRRWSEEKVYEGLEIVVWFDLRYTGNNLAGFNNIIPETSVDYDYLEFINLANHDLVLTQTVPEPATILLLGLGSTTLLKRRRR